MPEFLHPPYADTAKQLPKQLNRWLDINAQNGPLERNQAFFTLPAFSQAVDWKGYSNIVAAFNYEAPNNFSLKYLYQGSPNRGLLSPIPSNPNYSVAVMWIDKFGVVQRFFLWIAVGSVFYFPTTLYSNEKILKNFRLEIWSTNSSPSIQANDLTLFTSVRGTQDYRYGTDFALVKADVEVTNFEVANDGNGAVVVAGAGSSVVNGIYRQTAVVAGKPFYTKIQNYGIGLPSIITWNNLSNQWMINAVESLVTYVSTDNVATPDLVTTWTRDLGNGPDTLLPVPANVKHTYNFTIPINFPANSVPQPN